MVTIFLVSGRWSVSKYTKNKAELLTDYMGRKPTSRMPHVERQSISNGTEPLNDIKNPNQ